MAWFVVDQLIQHVNQLAVGGEGPKAYKWERNVRREIRDELRVCMQDRAENGRASIYMAGKSSKPLQYHGWNEEKSDCG